MIFSNPQQYANKHFESTLTHNNTCNYINQYNNIINNTKGSLGAIEHIGPPWQKSEASAVREAQKQ